MERTKKVLPAFCRRGLLPKIHFAHVHGRLENLHQEAAKKVLRALAPPSALPFPWSALTGGGRWDGCKVCLRVCVFPNTSGTPSMLPRLRPRVVQPGTVVKTVVCRFREGSTPVSPFAAIHASDSAVLPAFPPRCLISPRTATSLIWPTLPEPPFAHTRAEQPWPCTFLLRKRFQETCPLQRALNHRPVLLLGLDHLVYQNRGALPTCEARPRSGLPPTRGEKAPWRKNCHVPVATLLSVARVRIARSRCWKCHVGGKPPLPSGHTHGSRHRP